MRLRGPCGSCGRDIMSAWVFVFAKSMAEGFQTLRQYRLGKEKDLVAVG